MCDLFKPLSGVVISIARPSPVSGADSRAAMIFHSTNLNNSTCAKSFPWLACLALELRFGLRAYPVVVLSAPNGVQLDAALPVLVASRHLGRAESQLRGTPGLHTN